VTDRVLLICHGATAATRKTRFPVDEPLEANAVDAAAELGGRLDLPKDRHTLTAPTLRCRQTAAALGLTPVDDGGLADWDLGRWAGQTLDEVAAQSPADVQTWITEPDVAPHGGETLIDLLRRVGAWLDQAGDQASDQVQEPRPHRCVAVTHPAVIRAALVHALQAPAHSFWRIDIAPLAVVRLRGRSGRWSLHP
jgi:broad specificity phosphatase PhoE